MGNPESVGPAKPVEKTISAAAASGASHDRGHTLLPMLIGGLVLIVLGMLIVVFVV